MQLIVIIKKMKHCNCIGDIIYLPHLKFPTVNIPFAKFVVAKSYTDTRVIIPFPICQRNYGMEYKFHGCLRIIALQANDIVYPGIVKIYIGYSWFAEICIIDNSLDLVCCCTAGHHF